MNGALGQCGQRVRKTVHKNVREKRALNSRSTWEDVSEEFIDIKSVATGDAEKIRQKMVIISLQI